MPYIAHTSLRLIKAHFRTFAIAKASCKFKLVNYDMNVMHIRNIDLNLIAVFDAIMQEGSMSAAGVRLGMSQSAVSHALARLRAVTGDELFVRTSRGMRPTAHALTMAAPLQSAVDLCRLAFSKPRASNLPNDGRAYVIDLPVGFDLVFIPPLVAASRTFGVGAQFHVSASRARDLIADLRDGESELALDLEFVKSKNLRCQPLYDDEFLVCARKGRIDRIGTFDESAYLAAEHVTLAWNRGERSPVDERLSDLGLERRVTLTMPTLSGCASVAACCDVLFTIHRRIASLLAERFDLALFPMPIPIKPVRVYLIWHERFDDDAGHRWLRNALVQIARDLR